MYITNRICARANARSSSTLCKSSRLVDEREREGIDFFSFCHHHPFDPAFADIPSLFSSLSGKKRAPVDRPIARARVYTDLTVYTCMCRRKGWMRRSGQRGRRVYGGWGERRKKKKKEEKEYVADVTRAYGSARLGSARLARLEIFKALFGYPLSGEGGREERG